MNNPEDFPISYSFNQPMQALFRKIEAVNIPGNLEGLFAFHILNDETEFPLNWNVNCATEHWLSKNSESLNHFHVLAAAGYALKHFENTAPAAFRSAFESSLAKLRLRDPFPDDRVSFAYQPRAFLGIALGTITLSESKSMYRTWLMELLNDHRCQSSTAYHTLLHNYINFILTQKITLVNNTNQYTNLQEQALLVWGLSHNFLSLLDPHVNLSHLQAKLLYTFLTEDVNNLDSAYASLVWGAVHSSIIRSVERLVLSRNHVTKVLQRFEAALRRWRWDEHSKLKNPINWAIASEREVQDIVWLILRSAFDDVIDEETLPKLGHSTYRADFGIPSLRLLVEVKYCRETSDLKKIEKEIMEDVAAYLIHTKDRYESILVFIYDHSSSVQEHATTITALRKLHGVEDVIIVSRPSQIPGDLRT